MFMTIELNFSYTGTRFYYFSNDTIFLQTDLHQTLQSGYSIGSEMPSYDHMHFMNFSFVLTDPSCSQHLKWNVFLSKL